MDALEAKVKCLEFALVQAKNEGEHQNIDRVVEIQHRFYDVVAGNEGQELGQAPETEPRPTRGRKPRADKSEIFS